MTARFVVKWTIAGTEYQRTLAAAGEAEAIQRVIMDVASSVFAVPEDRARAARLLLGDDVDGMVVEYDDDHGWTVWQEGDHRGTFATEAEARAWIKNAEAVEAIDRDLFGGER